jgi:hypothetical protein
MHLSWPLMTQGQHVRGFLISVGTKAVAMYLCRKCLDMPNLGSLLSHRDESLSPSTKDQSTDPSPKHTFLLLLCIPELSPAPGHKHAHPATPQIPSPTYPPTQYLHIHSYKFCHPPPLSLAQCHHHIPLQSNLFNRDPFKRDLV